MERLITKYDEFNVPKELCTINRFGEADDCSSCAEICEECNSDCENCAIQKCFNKLADYEDAEEQGLLLRLPCKVGDKIYNPVFEYYKSGELIKEPYVIEAVVARFGFAKEELTIVLRNGIEYREFYADSIGKTVFLTKEEAEKALADMGV